MFRFLLPCSLLLLFSSRSLCNEVTSPNKNRICFIFPVYSLSLYLLGVWNLEFLLCNSENAWVCGDRMSRTSDIFSIRFKFRINVSISFLLWSFLSLSLSIASSLSLSFALIPSLSYSNSTLAHSILFYLYTHTLRSVVVFPICFISAILYWLNVLFLCFLYHFPRLILDSLWTCFEHMYRERILCMYG